jgi:hypothetical protein
MPLLLIAIKTLWSCMQLVVEAAAKLAQDG